ncbi:sensor domain-containing diguanylate cyclase [Novosphingobium mangrovi (ex Huang et al. 2023)]|uniref:diguanylate cyclase n=1 Tax=Novosphingobium mangrovi (ex Huang et al. 2023) TaxID=2976432 RepID=A0ABT2I8M0_9SPHN|nr:GGDEF domain-containing protein [Novosphingobium mangrovi (ex Huang et al. 2023)]MCT2401119.1 GGDEF domain-containing protein [Novosphingobium mangrovi (ex Huang et al. 2023)]
MARAAGVRDLARRQLLDDIVAFLIDHELEISEANLAVVLGICSGSNIALAKKVTDRRAAGLPVTQAWLDEQSRGGEDSIGRIADKLERSLESFAATSRSARDTAAQYNSEMQVHVEKAGEAEEQEQIQTLTTLARAMLERTQHLEQEMHRSEREAAKLRSSLAKARRDADHDHLTGLPNRRAFEGLLEHHLRDAQKNLEPLSVALCDVDNFKRINDTHGHDTGDRVLQAVAKALAKITDDNCHVARHGGEEFVMLFRGDGKTEALQRLDEVREAFGERNFVNRRTDEPIGKITFSGGVADVFAYPSARDALKAADVALYAAKEQGRNRIVAAD